MASDPFSTLIGHARIREVFTRMLAAGRLPHASLFVGPAQVGKTAMALMLLKETVAPGWTGPLEAHPELVVLRRETDEKTGKDKAAISVEQVREACARFSQTSFSGGRKGMFVEEADALNAAAANALLKTLEEPRGDAVMILRASSVDDVPATIASRCQVIRFQAVPEVEIASALVRRGVDREEAAALARASHGRPGAALRLLTDGEYRAQEETASEGARRLMREGIAPRLRAAAELLPKDEANKGAVALRTLETWERVLREELLARVGSADARRVAKALRRLGEARSAIRHNGSPQLALEHVLLGFGLG